MVDFDTVNTQKWVLTEEGEAIAKEGSHEVRVFKMIPSEGLAITQIQVSSNNVISSFPLGQFGRSR